MRTPQRYALVRGRVATAEATRRVGRQLIESGEMHVDTRLLLSRTTTVEHGGRGGRSRSSMCWALRAQASFATSALVCAVHACANWQPSPAAKCLSARSQRLHYSHGRKGRVAYDFFNAIGSDRSRPLCGVRIVRTSRSSCRLLPRRLLAFCGLLSCRSALAGADPVGFLGSAMDWCRCQATRSNGSLLHCETVWRRIPLL